MTNPIIFWWTRDGEWHPDPYYKLWDHQPEYSRIKGCWAIPSVMSCSHDPRFVEAIPMIDCPPHLVDVELRPAGCVQLKLVHVKNGFGFARLRNKQEPKKKE
ncbi:hypothetical protein LCGC14_2991550 [marine sediment metagenome]|uniref:Uncharacterized protein n=1 Tax=marine sediment metagenome TaxID=412755 RepID=A0A0F8XR84_9ZZZZ